MFDDLAGLAIELEASAAGLAAKTGAVVAKGALNVKTAARTNATQTAGRHARRAPSAITYDVAPHGTAWEAEIGYEKTGQGSLGNLLEFGSTKNPPHRDLGRALDVEEPRFLAALSEIATPWL